MRALIIITLACGLLACNNSVKETKSPSYPNLAKASWLLGSWQNRTAEAALGESWEQLNDSTYRGKGYFMKGTDTLSTEQLQLQQREGQLYYTALVNNQNKGEAIDFRLIKDSMGLLIFENPAHDFPQRITYTMIGSDSLVAEISGMLRGKMEKRGFGMGRKK